MGSSGVLALPNQSRASGSISFLLGHHCLLLLSFLLNWDLLHGDGLLPQSSELSSSPSPNPLLDLVSLGGVTRVRRSLPSGQDTSGQHAVQNVVGQVSRVVCHSVAYTGVQPGPVTSC